MIPVYASNGTFITRWNGRDYKLYSKYAPMLHADGFEFLMYNVWSDDVENLRKYLVSTGLSFPVTHMDKEIGETLATYGLEGREEAMRLFERDVITACEIGSTKLVMHLWNGLNSDSRFDETLCLYPEMHDMAEKRGLILATENVTCRDNLALDHLNAVSALCPGARFTYDTKMAFLHSENALLGTEKYINLLKSGAITHLHMNDSRRGEPGSNRSPILHIGEGVIDFDPVFALLKREKYDGTATVESTSVLQDGSVLVDKLNRSLDTVRARLNA